MCLTLLHEKQQIIFLNERSAMIKKSFKAEVAKVLHLMIHSLYTNKDIFLRELISNASDALDKLRYAAISNNALAVDDELCIMLRVEKAQNQIIIQDNGVGMNAEDLDNNLGTIAHSGTQRFVETMANNNNQQELANQIGKFGVGFYSAFMVADRVEVISRKAGEDKTYKWSSDGKGDYEITEENNSIIRGSKIILHLKPEAAEYLEEYKIRHIVKLYSDHISFPIYWSNQEEKGEQINSASALWCRPAQEISEEQYEEFYHHAAHLPGKPLLTLHNKAEGGIEYTNLLYVPSQKPYDLFRPERASRVKLYVRQVYITDEGVELIPPYLRFLRGVIDSEDLPLNISRESLQNNHVIHKIRKSVVRRVLRTLKELANKDYDKYREFWANFGEVMKEGLCEGALEEKQELLEVCRFYSSKEEGKLISLDEYIDHMQEGQGEIFYLNGDSIDAIRKSPQLEGFDQKGIEVLLLTDQVDHFWINVINEYKNKSLKSISSAGIDLNRNADKDAKNAESIKENAASDQQLIDFIKDVLGSNVSEVLISSKLTKSPACITIKEGAMNIKMEKMLLEQKQLHRRSAKIFEVNLQHPIVQNIAKAVHDGDDDSRLEMARQLVAILFDQACLLEGQELDDPFTYVQRLNSLLEQVVA